jgi:flagellar basal body-associated protein FliL
MRMTVMTAALLTSLTGGSIAATEGHATISERPALLTVDEIATPIFSAARIEGSLNLSLAIEGEDAAMLPALRSQMPQLRAAMLTTTLEFSRLYASGFTAIDAERLHADLTASVKRIHPGIKRVLILKLSASPA